MNTATEKSSKACPQCEGAGQEEIGALPVVCRKCGGSGAVPQMARVAAFMCGGSLEKNAQDDSEFTSDEEEGANEDNPIGSAHGSNIDPPRMYSSSAPIRETLERVYSLFTQMSDNPPLMNKLLDRLALILGSPIEEIERSVAGSNGERDAVKVGRYIAEAIVVMEKSNNRKQLYSLESEMKELC